MLSGAGIRISEFMAANSGTLLDFEGDSSDWIELHNSSGSTVDLAGWYLTDDDTDLTQWQIPDEDVSELSAGEYLVLFASKKDGESGIPVNELHTNFKLSKGGEYLALVMPDGTTIAHEYAPEFPPQLDDISYGISETILLTDTLVGASNQAKVLVPDSNALELTWTTPSFDDSSWTSGSLGIGFNTALGVVDYAVIDIGEVGQRVETGAQEVSTSGDDVNLPITQLVADGGDLFTIAIDNVNAAGFVDGEIDWRDRGNGPSDTLVALAEDFALNDDGVIRVTLGSLPLGTYSINSYHIDPDVGHGELISVFVTDAIGTNVQQVAVGNASVDVGGVDDLTTSFIENSQAVFSVVSNGTDDVIIYFDGSAKEDDAVEVEWRWEQDGPLAASDGSGVWTSAPIEIHDFDASHPDDGQTVQFTAVMDVPVFTQRDSLNTGDVFPATSPDDPGIGTVGFSNRTGGGASNVNFNRGVTWVWPTYTATDTVTLTATHDGVTYTWDVTTIMQHNFAGDDETSRLVFEAEIYDNVNVPGDGTDVIVDNHRMASWFGVPGKNSREQTDKVDFEVGQDLFSTESEADVGTSAAGAGIGVQLALRSTQNTIYFGDVEVGGSIFGNIQDISGGSNGVPLNGLELTGQGIPYDSLINTDIESAMLGINTSAYIRIPFAVADPNVYGTSMSLQMRYDDGFVAYLNGVKVAERNAPATLSYNSSATASHLNQQALTAEEIDLSAFTNLLVAGENVLAIHGLDAVDIENDFLIEAELFAERSITGIEAYFATPTPGATNISGSLGVVEDTQISVDRGFFYEPIQIEITTDTPAAEIRYTTNGSQPTATTGTLYTGSIDVTSTTTLRVSAFRPGFLAADIVTKTYLFPEDVLLQNEIFGSNGNGLLPSSDWGHTGGSGDWEVDPEIVNHANVENRLSTSDLLAVPTLSLVLPWEEMFGENGQGIYIQGEGVEQAVSVEQILPDGSSGFQIDASVHIFGGTSIIRWFTDKLSMRLKFKEEFGPTKLDNPIFGPEATNSFDSIVLDAVHNFGWTHRSTFHTDAAKIIQDQHVANLQKALGGIAPSAKYHHLYINGLYWGMFYVHERPDDTFAADYLGGDKDDYDIVKHGPGNVVSGTRFEYDALLALSQLDQSNDTNYQNTIDVLDVEGFIDYMLVNFYAGNKDWGDHNWYASFNRVDPNGKWRFHSWDAEYVYKEVDDDVTSEDGGGGPAEIHQNLLANDEYRLLFADRVQQHFFNEGVLSPENAAAEYQLLMDEVDRAIVGESARWGDNIEDGDNPYTRDSWLAVQADMFNNYFPARSGIVVNQLRAANGLFPSAAAEAPEFLVNGNPQHGGEIQAGDNLTFSNLAGTVYYTLDGTDPRLEGGAVSPLASAVSGPISLNATTTVRARLLTGTGEWSAIQGAFFAVEALATQQQQQLAISEVHYHPADPTNIELAVDSEYVSSDFEFLELTNTSASSINLTGMQFTVGVEYEFSEGTTSILAAGERLLIVNNRDAFELRYGLGLNIAGEFTGTLDDGGEQLRLRDGQGEITLDFSYSDGSQWPELADGIGASLILVDPLESYSDGANWRSSSEFHGSPGVAGNEPLADIIINEVLSHSDGANPDLIELLNLSASPIDVSGWTISDQQDDLSRGTLPPGSIIAPGAYAVFDQSQFGFGLNADKGETLWLIETSPATGDPLRFADVIAFEGSETEVSLGRWDNADPSAPFISMVSQTFGSPNSGPVLDTVRISEVFYNAAWFDQDFADGSASGFNPLQGNLSVLDETYIGLPTVADPLAVLDPTFTLPDVFKIEADLLVPETTAFDRNAAILFDYQSSTDFKFARMDTDAGRWQLGERTGSTWNVLAEVAEKLVPGFEYGVTLEIHDTEARLIVEGVEKLRLDYANNLADGNIGISSENGEFELHRFQVDPLDDVEFEFVELYNSSVSTIDISNWKLDAAIDFTFSVGTTIQAAETLLIVGFDPADAGALNAFQTRFGIDGSVLIVGGYEGRLANDGETLQLTRLVGQGNPVNGHLVVDGVSYSDQTPWPTAGNDGNRSLQLNSISAFGNNATSWQAGLPTPGAVNFTPLQLGDANGDGDVDAGDLLAWQGGYGTSSGATRLIGDFNSDGAVSGFDFLIWQRNFGASTGASSAIETPALSQAVVSATIFTAPTPVAASLASSRSEDANSISVATQDARLLWQSLSGISMAVPASVGILRAEEITGRDDYFYRRPDHNAYQELNRSSDELTSRSTFSYSLRSLDEDNSTTQTHRTNWLDGIDSVFSELGEPSIDQG